MHEKAYTTDDTKTLAYQIKEKKKTHNNYKLKMDQLTNNRLHQDYTGVGLIQYNETTVKLSMSSFLHNETCQLTTRLLI